MRVGEDVSFGAYVVVHDGTVIGDGCAIEDHAVLGKRPRLAGHSLAHGDVGALELGAGADRLRRRGRVRGRARRRGHDPRRPVRSCASAR